MTENDWGKEEYGWLDESTVDWSRALPTTLREMDCARMSPILCLNRRLGCDQENPTSYNKFIYGKIEGIKRILTRDVAGTRSILYEPLFAYAKTIESSWNAVTDTGQLVKDIHFTLDCDDDENSLFPSNNSYHHSVRKLSKTKRKMLVRQSVNRVRELQREVEDALQKCNDITLALGQKVGYSEEIRSILEETENIGVFLVPSIYSEIEQAIKVREEISR